LRRARSGAVLTVMALAVRSEDSVDQASDKPAQNLSLNSVDGDSPFD
jgi:hypothetical protein